MTSKLLTLVGAASFALCAASASGQTPTQIKFASFIFPTAELNTNVFAPFIKSFNDELKGAVEIKLFPGGTLGRDPAQQYKLVRDSVAEMGYIVQGYTPGDFPDVTISTFRSWSRIRPKARLRIGACMRRD